MGLKFLLKVRLLVTILQPISREGEIEALYAFDIRYIAKIDYECLGFHFEEI